MVISFANQKGGSQKSTLSRLLATSLHFGVPQLRVAVIDCDSQATNTEIRNRDLALLDLEPESRERFEKLLAVSGKPLYPIVQARLSKPGDVKQTVDTLQKKGYNFIIIDFPGNTEIPGVSDALLLLKYIFVPVFCDDGSIKSSVAYITAIRALMFRWKKLHPPLEEIYVLFTLFNPDVQSRAYQIFLDLKSEFQENGVKVLENPFYASPEFQFELASTLFPFPTTKPYEKISPYPLFMEIVDLVYGQTAAKKAMEEAREAATTIEDDALRRKQTPKKAANE